MHLAILHYHLRRGGVTRVIENQLLALDAVLDSRDPWRVALVHGGRQEGQVERLAGRLRAIRLSSIDVPGLDYDVERPGQPETADGLFDALASAFDRHGFVPGQTLLHVHNHSLGKNRALPAIVPRLAARGHGVVLQIHDFAEDFRPSNYCSLGRPAPTLLYPQAANIHYAVLNARDHAILAAAGVDPTRLHLLPNPVLDVDILPDRHHARRKLDEHFGIGPDDRFLLYPVRCIRRKNIGEALLYGVLSSPGTIVGLTLAPANPAELPIYDEWKQTARELELPCRFEVGGPGALTFMENLAAADAVLTTSLAEGFGMVMLESWLAGRPLVGRDLPEITPDFTAHGVRLGWLRPRLLVPLEWIGRDVFRGAWTAAYRRALAAYGRPVPSGLNAALDAKTAGGKIDFGDLDELQQRRVLDIVRSDARSRRRGLDANPRLEASLAVDGESASTVVAHNAQVVKEHFSLVPSGRRLLEMYGAVPLGTAAEPYPLSHPERLLDIFLAPERFRMIRG